MTQVSLSFERLVGGLLADNGLLLTNDPHKARDPYGSSTATFVNEKGFGLQFLFLPMDGQYAKIRCGRRFETAQGSNYYSGPYQDLARRFGIEVSKTYSLKGARASHHSLRTMRDELKASLPVVVEKATISDLESIELGEFGAIRWIQREFRSSPEQAVRVSVFGSNEP